MSDNETDPWVDHEDDAVAALRTGLALSALPLTRLWLDHLALGGDLASPTHLAQVLAGTRLTTHHQLEVVAQALDDHFITTGTPYRLPPRPRSPQPVDGLP